MNPYILGSLIAIGLIIAYVIGVYNSLQTLKVRIRASIQEIGNQLKRQANLIPNLSESAKGYLSHEQDIFKMLTDARKSIVEAQAQGGSKVDEAINKLNAVIPRLNIMVESNPELKADNVVSKLMNELRDTADKIMYSRRALIDLSADYNRRLVTFPSNMVANAFGFKPEKGLEVAESGDHLQVSDQDLEDVKIDLKN
jgi:LemA protein